MMEMMMNDDDYNVNLISLKMVMMIDNDGNVLDWINAKQTALN